MANPTQTDIARKAMELKQSGAKSRNYLMHQSATAGDGPIPAPNQVEPVSGALEAEGQRPVLERSRKVR